MEIAWSVVKGVAGQQPRAFESESGCSWCLVRKCGVTIVEVSQRLRPAPCACRAVPADGRSLGTCDTSRAKSRSRPCYCLRSKFVISIILHGFNMVVEEAGSFNVDLPRENFVPDRACRSCLTRGCPKDAYLTRMDINDKYLGSKPESRRL